MGTISKEIPVWPPIEEMIASTKWAVIQHLDHIAENITNTVRPKTKILQIPVALPLENVVIKRERSDTCRHCLFPQHIKNMSAKKLNEYLNKNSIDDCYWLHQEFVPLLRQFGEWRVYFIGGQLSFTLLTEVTPKGVFSIRQGDCWTLEELTCDLYLIYLDVLANPVLAVKNTFKTMH